MVVYVGVGWSGFIFAICQRKKANFEVEIAGAQIVLFQLLVAKEFRIEPVAKPEGCREARVSGLKMAY